MGEIREGMDPADVSVQELPSDPTEGSAFYDDLDLHVVGTLSKGRDARLSLAVVSANGNHLYAFMREDALGHLEDCTRMDDA